MRMVRLFLCLGLLVCQIHAEDKSKTKKEVVDARTTRFTFHPVPSEEEVAELAGSMNGERAKGVPDVEGIIAQAEEPLKKSLS